MDCECQCTCSDHESCGCRYLWCSCLIQDRSKKRKRCHGKGILETDSMMSLSGFFIGQFCSRCGLKSRISEFYQEHSTMMKVFDKHRES